MVAGGAPAMAVPITFAVSLVLALSLFSSATFAADSPPAPAYANHTVGGSAGWFFNSSSNSSATNYNQWASAQNFFLGDFLIFNTDSSNTVVKTLNATTYARCDFSDDDGNDISFYYDGSGGQPTKVTVPVPLTDEGANYFFSAADSGAQCLQGMRFRVTVAHGRGLPPSLNQPPPPPHVDLVPPPSPDIMVTPTPIASDARGADALRDLASLALFGLFFY